MNDRRKIWVWVGVVVVVIAAAWALVAWLVGMNTPTPNVAIPVHAPVGQVVSGFPHSLVLDNGTSTASSSTTSSTSSTSSASSAGASSSSTPSGATLPGVTNSYSINYSSSTNQYTTQWNSSSSPATVYADYEAYAAAHNWTITNRADTATLKGIYAVDGSVSVSVVITPLTQGNTQSSQGSAVTVTYLKN